MALHPQTTNMTFRVTLFGRPRIRCGDVALELALSNRDLLTLVALLLPQDGACSREEIAFSLWPDLTEAEARAALRRSLYRLQRVLPPSNGPWIHCKGRSITWAARETTWVDVNEFERLSREADGIDEALGLYRADFLEHVDHEWVNAHRERLRQRACKLLSIAATSRGEDEHRRLSHLERLLTFDPWREDIVREMLHVRCSLGDRAGALASYLGFKQRLAEEIGIEPMPETVHCYRSIMEGRVLDDLAQRRQEKAFA